MARTILALLLISLVAGCGGATADPPTGEALAPVGWQCRLTVPPDGYAVDADHCAGVDGCGARPPVTLTADLPDVGLLLPAAPASEPVSCTDACHGYTVASMVWVWVPPGREALVSAPGRGVLGEPYRCGDPAMQPSTIFVHGGANGARAWVLARPGAGPAAVRVRSWQAPPRGGAEAG